MLRNKTIEGVLALCAGVLIFSVQDAILKQMSGAYAVTEAMFIRAVVALPILFAMVVAERGTGGLKTRRFGIMAGRGVLLLVAYTTYYMALPALPLATAVALFFVVPLLVSLLAAAFLGEPTSWRTYAAIAIGFAGVLVITTPSRGLFEWAALLSLASACLYAVSMVIARRIGETEVASVMAFHLNWVYLVAALAAAGVFHTLGFRGHSHPSLDFLLRPWTMPTSLDLALMALCGVIAAVAMWFLGHAYRVARANIVSVFEYTGLIWAPLWGFVFFSEVPAPRTWGGIALIVAAGLIVLFAPAGSVRPAPKRQDA